MFNFSTFSCCKIAQRYGIIVLLSFGYFDFCLKEGKKDAKRDSRDAAV